MTETERQAKGNGSAKATILVVEDEDLVRDLARGILEQSGFRVLVAGSVDEAVSLGTDTSETVHAMLCDVVMPGRSGPEIFGAIAEERPDMKVLYMSGYPIELIDKRGLLPAGVPFIQKPFSPDELSDRVRCLLE
jgi:DNA-binding response OmpR family regulator